MQKNHWRWIIWGVLIFVAVNFFMQNRRKAPEGDERVVLQVGQVGFTIRDFKHLLSEQSPEEMKLPVGERKQRLLDRLTQTAVLLQYTGRQQWGADSELKLSVWQLAADYAKRRIVENFGKGAPLSNEERERIVASAVKELRDSLTITIHENMMSLVGFDSPATPSTPAEAEALPIAAEQAFADDTAVVAPLDATPSAAAEATE